MAGPAIKRRKLDDVYAAGTSKNNMFKLQVDDLLEHLRPRDAAREPALHQIKTTIEQIPAREPQPIDVAVRQLKGVAVPFPEPRPPKDAKYQLGYAKPANVNITGSYALQTRTRTNHTVDIDMLVTMPDSLFQDKDYLNHRYFHKRAFYLACIATALKDAHSADYELKYQYFHGDSLKPILTVSPLPQQKGSQQMKPAAKWRINIMLCTSDDTFAEEKISPTKNCVRAAAEETPQATPFYNSSLRADTLVTPYLKLLHSSSSTCSAFRDACLLGRTWLQQRGIGADIADGGFGAFEWSALAACMLQGGGPNGKPLLSEGYSSYQLFKATLQVLAMKDLSRQGFNIGHDAADEKPAGDGTPMFWDGDRLHNILYKVSPWSYTSLRQEARITLTMLGDQLFSGFEATFIFKTDNASLRYDYNLQLTTACLVESNVSNGTSGTQLRKTYDVLKRGLGDRITQIAMRMPKSEPWQVSVPAPGSPLDKTISIGLTVNAETVNRTVDHGPAAESKSEAASFREFWGEKAELRRFKDGSILESLIWSTLSGGQSPLEQIVRYLFSKHFGEKAEQGVTFSGDGFVKKLGQSSALSSFQAFMDGYKQLETDIRSLDDLPLSIRQIMPADEQLRYSSSDVQSSMQHKGRSTPSDVTIQFEGSARWPDDLAAIQRTKIAFLIMLSELLTKSLDTMTARIGLENEGNDVLNQGYLQIVYDSGLAFRLRIYHDREQTLLERILKDASFGPQAKETAAFGLATYKRDYLIAPAHTQAIARLCNRYPALSGTMRLMKKWFASHLLTNHIASEVIEMITVRTFVQQWPWQTPSSVQTGFLRTLHWLSRWDWRAEPLLVDFSGTGELKKAEAQAINTRFEAWRKLDPSMNRIVLFAASSVDPDGTTWTDGRPAKVVAGRMTALAKAACAELEQQKAHLNPDALFVSSLTDYDFVIHLNSTAATGRRRKSGSNGKSYKNLELDSIDDHSLVGFDPASAFLQELEHAFGSAVVFFSGGHERPVIAGLWSPLTAPRAWKVNLAYATVPEVLGQEDEGVLAVIDKKSILAEISRLGGELVEEVRMQK